MATHGVPNVGWRRVRNGDRYPSSAMANGMRVEESTVLLRMEMKVMAAAMVIAKPSQGPPINRAASEKKRVCQSCQFPSAAKAHAVGTKYVAIESGTTQASARG